MANKRIQDLPEAASVDGTEDVLINKNGATKRGSINKIKDFLGLTFASLDENGYIPISLIRKDILEQLYSYGVEYDTNISSPTLTRIGNLDLHRTLPIQSKMRGCLLDDNGVIVKYLNPSDWTSETRDGSKGQVMVEIPAHYRKFQTDGNKRRIYISEIAIPEYHLVEKCYISAYEASLNRVTNKLSSVVNMSADYRGGGNQSAWDGTYRSVLGRPATYLSRTQFRSLARNRNSSATSEWNCNMYSTHKTVTWLFMIEYATRNCQLPYTPTKDANGFSQGGLGDGVTNTPDWGGYNGYYPFTPCGHTDNAGNNSVERGYNMTSSDGSVLYVAMVNRYRGIENPFGHIWKWTDGINIEIKTNADGGTSSVYVCDKTDKLSDSSYDYYDFVGLESRVAGYVRDVIFGGFGEIIPSNVGAGSTTFFCDYHYTDVNSSVLRGVLFGGHADDGATAGFVSSHSNPAPSDAFASIGSRICFIPITKI